MKVDLPESFYLFLKEKKKSLEKAIPLPGGLSVHAKSYILVVKSDENNTIEKYVFRQFSQEKNTFEQELYISTNMAELGISPKIVFHNDKELYWLMEFIENSVIFFPRKVNEAMLKQAGQLLKKIHDFKPKIKINDIKLDYMLQRAKNTIKKYEVCKIFNNIFEKMKEIENILEKNGQKCFCHNDIGQGANLIWNQKRVYIIDWELSGEDYPYCDIGTILINLLFTPEHTKFYLDGYYGRERTEKEEALIFFGGQYGVLRYVLILLGKIQELPSDITKKDVDEILEWNQLLTGKMKLQREEFGTSKGAFKTADMLFKQAEINLASEKCKIMKGRLKA